jgi:hypothetical protein
VLRSQFRAPFTILIGALAVCLSIAAFEATLATARSEADLSTIVDRARKGDRLPLIPASSLRGNPEDGALLIKLPRAPVLDSKLPVGCESIVRSIGQSRLAPIVGRCLS